MKLKSKQYSVLQERINEKLTKTWFTNRFTGTRKKHFNLLRSKRNRFQQVFVKL